MVFELSKINVVVAAHAGVAFWHTLALLEMLCPYRCASRASRARHVSSSSVLAPKRFKDRVTNHWLFVKFFSRRGVLGLESVHFSEVFALREALETLLQTLQAYRLSQFVARRDINNVFVALLVINCWITPFIQQRFADRVALQRLLCLSTDIVQDFATTVLVPSVLLVPYVHQFDWRVGDFPMTNCDLIMRLIFSISMILSMNKVKYLLSFVAHVPPTEPQIHPQQENTVELFQTRAPGKAALHITSTPLLVRVLDATSIVWGLIVLFTFITAERQPSIPSCAMQTRPWFAVRPSYALLVVTCETEDSSAQLSRMRQQLVLNQVQPSTVMSLVLRDCPALHVSPQLATLQRLVGLKIANSSIVSWTGDAVLRDALHPHLLFVFMERVSFPDGLLPDGLLAADFPRRLLDIEVCVSNLRALPDDLHEKWGAGGIVFLERSALTHVPPVLLKMEIVVLSLYDNAITEIPADLIAHPTLYLLGLVDNPIKTLPPLNDVTTAETAISAATNKTGTDNSTTSTPSKVPTPAPSKTKKSNANGIASNVAVITAAAASTIGFTML
ncbi:hypothetical protein P43SY_004698 [Pythium insidiosum]|uniref:Uncharacterized protein n=1 Tax=Pythium insidiosum TaxID=114742 RepID=A0AAD5LGZ7_PYTIN|nr:hypothetical protein P43SY_004698 [Pythium insidiosum]